MIDYDAHEWTRHLFDVRGSMVREIIGRVMFFVAWATLVVGIHHYHPIAINSTVHALVGVALGLLLVFRTNASYDRFWEGRKMWGGIVNETRNLARVSRVMIAPAAPELHDEIVKWTTAWVYASMHALRNTRGIGPIADQLPADEVARVLAAQHVPLAIAARISELIATARARGVIGEYAQLAIDQNVQLLIDYIGACERIHRTPLPFAYVVHLRRALIIYCATLPFALVKDFGWGTVLDTFFVAYIFFGIEEIGVEIEDPFGMDDNDLPLERICQTIATNLAGLFVTRAPSSTSLPAAEHHDDTARADA